MMMAEALRDDDEVFVYMGGDQQVPRHVRRVRIHRSVKIIPARAFYNRRYLIYVEFHDEIEIIKRHAFDWCWSLRGPIKLLGVKIVKNSAFSNCTALTGVEFGDVLETIEGWAFYYCIALTNIKMPSVRTIGFHAFTRCSELSDVECGEDLETIQQDAFDNCRKLKRIALPLKDNIIGDDVFRKCFNLATVDLVGGILHTVTSLHMESWRNEMMDEINRINQVLPNTARFPKRLENGHFDSRQKTTEIQQWMRSVIQELNHFKAEHHKILKEAATLLELALWKTNLDDNEGGESVPPLTGVEFGDVLETIEEWAFYRCSSLRSITMPSVKTIRMGAFTSCYELSDVVCGEDLKVIRTGAFDNCHKLKRIVLPLKTNMIYPVVFDDCPKLVTVELVGGIHSTVASLSLHMESWRNEMEGEINRINQVLPNTDNGQKTAVIKRWMRSVIRRINYYKAEHHNLLKEATTSLELALWKANLDDNEGGEREGVRTTRGSRKRARKEISVKSGANVVIKNVLPYLRLDDVHI
eukprot:CAMPEP_0201710236 /NCGR_PEP_ID=MMETSP0578-20130828/58524_1 /ASSEMBLY_ACC=CAM_ASM_000663 /TAXON_ID=267565 /ORGANISM="Skeletonema grethea, Strain CCMP 1804" /LENGTH=525 /DNA_ID=CAMNT_0048199261 /DNA_START=143 /DNA_END=1719 /DNA_ORIENTATION=+